MVSQPGFSEIIIIWHFQHNTCQRVPQVTASTAVLMILFSSSAIALSFYFQGLLNVSYAAVLAPACFVASLVGTPGPCTFSRALLPILYYMSPSYAGQSYKTTSTGECRAWHVSCSTFPSAP